MHNVNGNCPQYMHHTPFNINVGVFDAHKHYHTQYYTHTHNTQHTNHTQHTHTPYTHQSQVSVWVFGDGFPASNDQPSTLFFSLGVAAVGVAFFALSLALVQQVVFDFYTSYVQRGSAVYEAGHVRV